MKTVVPNIVEVRASQSVEFDFTLFE